jgi:peptidoglycan/LPS O-acetylase OafA/YrhL
VNPIGAARTADLKGALPSAPAPTTDPTTAPRRFENLDGLRGVAALMVLVYHSVMVVPQFSNPEILGRGAGSWAWFDYSPLRIVLSGTEGVLVFFILSGFVLTMPVLRAATFAWRAYYPSRILRLYVPVVASILWCLIVITLLPRKVLAHDPSSYMSVHAEPATLLKIARDVVLLDGANSINGPLWSLQWEMWFSLLLPLYVFLAVKLKRAWLQLTFALAALSAVGTAFVPAHPSLEYMPAFGIGALFAAALPSVMTVASRISGLPGRRHSAAWVILTVVASLLLTARWWLAPEVPAHILGLTAFPVLLGAALFVFIALGSAGARAVLTTRVVLWLGMISFSLYLTHEPIVVGVAQLLPRRFEDWSGVISVPISLVVGWLFYKAVERPAHRLSQYVKRRLAPSAPKAPTGSRVAGAPTQAANARRDL